MAGEDIITMSQRELNRLHIIHKVLDKELKQVDAGEILGLSDRQVRRIVRRVREEEPRGIIHKSRGKPSNRSLSKKIKKEAIRLYKDKYPDFGPKLANEKLFEIDKIKIADQTLRNWLIEAELWKARSRRREHRQWRERKNHFGEMLQGDGSHHDWFEARGAACVLMGYIDDATGKVFAMFYEYEGTIPAMDSFKRYLRKYGIPQSIYMDNHSTYKSQAKPTFEEELAGKEPLSQFERALGELGVEFIHARSPQAKGRIERLFKTFQDRLVKEMRLAGIKSIEEANKFLEGYLPGYNKRYSVLPARRGNLHRALEKHINLNDKLCIKTPRALRNDFTVAHNKKLYQILEKTKAQKVVVEEKINGSLFILYEGNRLRYKEIEQRPIKAEPKKKVAKKIRIYTVSSNHPWKRWTDRGYPQNPSYQQKEKSSKKEKELLLVH